MPLLYNIGVGLYHAGIHLTSPFNPKAKAWVEGRSDLWQRLEAKREALHGCLWMHCASVGEFEQGRPVLEALKKHRPELPVLITFYSPSGYEARKAFPLATHVEYLPADGKANASRLLDLVQPRAVLWVKYEFWHHWLSAIATRRIPLFLISAIFRKEQPFFKWFGASQRGLLKCFTEIFAQDEASRSLLASIGVNNVTVSGDTRFDRVAEIAAANEDLSIASSFKGNKLLLVAGSTWPADEALLEKAFVASGSSPKCIITPHELSDAHLASAEARFAKPLARWSELGGTTPENIANMLGPLPSATLIVDRMGLLARLYKYADVAYVGGGFGDGIHSLLEAAAWGKPVIFGPNHHKFAEAKGLIEVGGGFEVNDVAQLQVVLDRLLKDPSALTAASDASRDYVRKRTGATDRIVRAIAPLID